VTAVDDFAVCKLILAELDGYEPDFRKKKREYRRAGLPSSSVPEAVGGSKDYTPSVDSADRDLSKLLVERSKALEAARKQLWKALKKTQAVVIEVPPLPDPVHYPCSNLRCPNVLEGSLTSGECARCRKHRSRYGLGYPEQPTSSTL